MCLCFSCFAFSELYSLLRSFSKKSLVIPLKSTIFVGKIVIINTMKLRNLFPALLSAVLITLSLSAHAQKSWTPPTMPEAVEFANDQSYYIQNVGTGQFLTAANSWATQISVGTDGQPYMRFAVQWREAGENLDYIWRDDQYRYSRYLTTFAAGYMITVDGEYTVSSTTPINRTNWTVGNTVLFRDNELSGFIDLNHQTYGYLWKFTPVGNGDYFIQTVEGDTQFPNAATQCMAAYNAGEAVAFNAEMTMNEDGYYDSHLLWRFYSAEGVQLYQARMELYNTLIEARDAGVDTSAASAVYNDSSASVDELTAALEQLRSDISAQGLDAIIADASAENPVDITDYVITNADFSQGNLNGWSVEGWTPGSSIQGNVMYQRSTITGESGVTMSGFIESWCSSTYAPLSDGAFRQTLIGLPAGRYRLEADCIAVDQYNGTAATGAYLFAEDATGTRHTHALATGNESPQHFELSFSLASAGDITIGVRAESTNINWLAADNFRLTYYGNDGDELAFLAAELSREIEAARALQSQIPSGAWTRLSAVISQYDLTYTTAAQYNTAIEAVRNTRLEAQTLVTPYANYLSVLAQTDSITDHSSDAWETLNVAITTANSTVNATTVTAQQIVEATADLSAALAAYNATQGGTYKDITTAYITNPSPYASTDGWETPNGQPNAFDSVNRCAEFWNRQGYVLQQTLHDLPAGDYTLTAIAFTRTGFNATLFAGDTSIPLVTVGSDVVNSRYQANAWFNAGNGVNSLNFTMAAAGDITIGIRAATENDGWTAWRSFTLTTGNTGQEGRTVGDQFTVTNAQGYELTFTVTSATTCALTAAPDIDGLTIPEQADGLQVKEIGEGVFQTANLTSINLPTTIQTIGKNAFRGSKLTAFPYLPNLRSIGTYAFYACTGLTEIVLGPSVESIGNYAFFGNSNITSVVVQATTPPTGQSNIFSSKVYSNATLTLSEGTKSAYQNASPWSSFTTIIDGTELDDGDTFSYTYQGVTLQYTVLSASNMTCSVNGGADVSTVTVPTIANNYTVVAVGDGAFQDASLTSINLPTTIQTIGQNAFRGSQLATFPDLPNLRTIGNYAFYGCTNLTKITLGARVTSIGSYAFFGNGNITSITVRATTPPTAQSTSFSTAVYTNATLTVPEGRKSAYQSASPWSSFTTITDGTEPKEGDTFSYTYKGVPLEYTVLSVNNMTCSVTGGAASPSVSVPTTANGYTVVAIGDRTFQNIKTLENITLPSTLQTIGAYAFYSTGLTTINIPASVTSIGSYAFYGISGITQVTVNSETPPTAQSTSFASNTYTNAELRLNKGGKAAYASAEPWSRFKNVFDATGKYITIVVQGNGTVSYTNVEGKTFTASTGSTDIPLDEDVNPITLQVSAAMGSRFEKAVYDKVTEQEDYTSRVNEDGSLSMGVYRGGTTLTVTFAERKVWHLNVDIVGNGSLSYTNGYGQTFTAGLGSTSIPIYEDENPVTFHIAAAEGYRYAGAKYDKVTAVEDYTSRLKEDGSFAMGVYRDGTTLTVTFVERSVELNLLREGKGTVKLNGEVLTFSAIGLAILDVSKMKNFLFNLQPDAGSRLNQVAVNGDDVTNLVDGNGNLDLTEYLVDGVYSMYIQFVEGFPTFASNDCTFGIPDLTKNEVRVMPRNYLNRDVLIPETVERNGTTYTVTSVEDAAFAGNEQLRSVSLPSTIQSVGSNLFDGCTHLAAIVWNRTLPFSDEAMGSFRNPNLLFYTKYSSHAPQNSGVNILWKGDNDYYQSNKVIRLQEGINYFDFYCPIPFYAAQIEYVHQFTMETQPQTAKGWETLVLPFTVKNVYHNNLRRDIVPYATVSEDDVIHGAHPFWLYTYSADGDKAWVEADSIRANQPYIISMPNNSKYPADYQMAGKVTFTSKDIWVPATEEVTVTRGTHTLHANFQTQDVPSYYLLNVKNDFFRNSTGRDDGSTFVLRTKFADSRPAMPFECYFTTTAAGVKEIGLFEEVVDAVRELPADLPEKEVEGIYDLSGRKIANGQGTVDKGQLSRGIYIVNGRKVLVR